MNLLCPNCQKTLQVPEQFAGQMMKCPLCAGTFTTPGMSAVPAGVPTPPVVPSVLAPVTAPLAGYQHVYSLAVNPAALCWLAPAALCMVFVLLFFPWIEAGVSVGEHYGAASGWQTALGELSNGLGLFYLLLYLATTLTAFAAAFLPLLQPATLPPALLQLLPLRSLLVAAAVLLTLSVLLIQNVTSFGPEGEANPIHGLVRQKDLTIHFVHTFYLRLALFLHVLALAASTLEAWLTLRNSSKPLPRIDVNW